LRVGILSGGILSIDPPESTKSKTTAEQTFNILAGLSVIAWGLLGLLSEGAEDGIPPVRLSIAVVNGVVGLSFIRRHALVRSGACQYWLLALPSFLVCGFSFRLAQPTTAWPLHAESVFVAGSLLTVITFLYLGRSFAVLPAVRDIVIRGPYRIIRHPAYLGELLMVLACYLAASAPLAIWPIIAVVPSVVVRIWAEEKVIGTAPAYQTYAEVTRWRLVPGLW